MKLNLSVAGKVLASTTVAPFLENNEYHLKAFRRQLVLRHRTKLRSVKNELMFSVELPADNMQHVA